MYEHIRLYQVQRTHDDESLIFSRKTYLKRFSAPDLSISSLLICMLSLDLWVCSLPRHVAARGSEPLNEKW